MNISTVPRKRRPRAAGEVSISSESFVYLTNDKSNEKCENKEADHLYENAIPKIIINEKKPIRIEYQSGLCSCRLVQPDNSGDERLENQLITVFIGKFGVWSKKCSSNYYFQNKKLISSLFTLFQMILTITTNLSIQWKKKDSN